MTRLWQQAREALRRRSQIDATRPKPAEEPPSGSPGGAPTITALLEDGPLAGASVAVEVVEGRPPKTLDFDDGDGGTCRYGLSKWVQRGPAARYSYLYPGGTVGAGQRGGRVRVRR